MSKKPRQHLLLLRRCYTSAKTSTAPNRLLPPVPCSALPKTLAPSRCQFCSDGTPDRIRDRIHLLTEKPTSLISDGDLDDIKARVSSIADEILTLEDVERVAGVLDARSVVDLLRRSPNGSASVELLSRLKAKPHFALEVFNWRRRQADAEIPLQAEEYSKAITLAGRTKDIDLAVGLFCDAARTLGFQSTCVYNSLISAYMYNGYTKKAISVFGDLERDPNCKPSIVTYNILLSVFGRSMLVNHMEAILKTIDQSDDLSPTLTTYNTVIAGYVTAWMWGRMESTFHRMETGTVKPDASTYLLMLRGYAHSNNMHIRGRGIRHINLTLSCQTPTINLGLLPLPSL